MNDNNKFPHLSNAPITEAMIDIQTASKDPISIDVLRSVAQALKEEFPIAENKELATMSFSANESAPRGTRELQGFLVRSEDKLYAAQILINRFSLSRLMPYKDWGDLRNYSEKLWSIYKDIVKPIRVKRLAVRYINRLLLPDPTKQLSYYFTKPLEIPEELPQALANYVTRMVIPEPESSSVAIVQQVMEGMSQENQASIIFDIDAFKEVDFGVGDNEMIWSTLENLREYKNRIFFKTLTNNTIEMYL